MAMLFENFSFSKPATRGTHYDEIAPLEELGLSRSPSPFSSASPARKQSISADFLFPSLQDISSTPISARLLGADRRRNSLAREYFETIRARRQAATRAQCDPRRASAIRLYVQNLLSEDSNHSELHPSSTGLEFPSPQRSAPPKSFYEETSRTSTSEEEDAMETDLQNLSLGDKKVRQRSSSSGSGSSRQRHGVQKTISKAKAKPRTRC